jgi:hypothetical protein
MKKLQALVAFAKDAIEHVIAFAPEIGTTGANFDEPLELCQLLSCH